MTEINQPKDKTKKNQPKKPIYNILKNLLSKLSNFNLYDTAVYFLCYLLSFLLYVLS